MLTVRSVIAEARPQISLPTCPTSLEVTWHRSLCIQSYIDDCKEQRLNKPIMSHHLEVFNKQTGSHSLHADYTHLLPWAFGAQSSFRLITNEIYRRGQIVPTFHCRAAYLINHKAAATILITVQLSCGHHPKKAILTWGPSPHNTGNINHALKSSCSSLQQQAGYCDCVLFLQQHGS